MKMMINTSLENLLAEIVQWGDETFPTVSLRAKIEHLRREVEELQKTPTAAEEIADIFMITAHIASEVGVDLKTAIADKFEIVKAREWGEPDAAGVVEHKKSDSDRIEWVRKNTPRYLLEDLLHVYDNWTDPRIKLARLLDLVDRGWVYENTEGELVIWEVTGLGWSALENAGLVPKPHGR
jgi:hypothetical protein